MSEDFEDPTQKKKSALPLILGIGGVLLIACAGGVILIVVGLIFPALAKVEETQERLALQKNLREIGIASHMYESSMGDLIHNRYDFGNTRALTSWRVQLLPCLEHDDLFNRLDWMGPWDSPQNKQFGTEAVKHYCIPNQPLTTQTHLQAFSGPGAALDPKSPRDGRLNGKPAALTISTIPDGASNTIFVVESGTQVNYLQPVDLNYPSGPIPQLGWEQKTGRFAVLYFDSSTRICPTKRVNDNLLTKSVVVDDGVDPLKD